MLLWLVATVVAIIGVQLIHGDVLLVIAGSAGVRLIGPGGCSGLPSLRTA